MATTAQLNQCPNLTRQKPLYIMEDAYACMSLNIFGDQPTLKIWAKTEHTNSFNKDMAPQHARNLEKILLTW